MIVIPDGVELTEKQKKTINYFSIHGMRLHYDRLMNDESIVVKSSVFYHRIYKTGRAELLGGV